MQHVKRNARPADGAVSGVYDVTGSADDIQRDSDHPGGDHQEATTRHHHGARARRGRDSRATRDRDEQVRDECRERADDNDVPVHAAHPVAGPVDAGEDGVGVKRHDADGEDQAGDGHVEEEDVGRRHVATAGVEHGAHQRVGDDGENHRDDQQRRLGGQLRRASGRHPVTGHSRHRRVVRHCRAAVVLHCRRQMSLRPQMANFCKGHS